MKQYFSSGKLGGTELRKTKSGLLLGLGDDRCSKFHNSSSRTRNLEVVDFLERWFSYLQVLFRSRSGLKVARALNWPISSDCPDLGIVWPRRYRVVSSSFLASKSNQTNFTRMLKI